MSKKINESVLEWLLEPIDISVKYLAMRDLVETDLKDFTAIKESAHKEGPIADVLAKMQTDGYWEQPGAGYYPKYTGTVWSVSLLAQLGASLEMDTRIETACSYLIETQVK